MVRFNLLTLAGFIVSAVTIPAFWLWLFLGMYSFGSGEPALLPELRLIQGTLAVLFMVGTFLALLSPLAFALQVPGVIVFPMLLWYGHDLAPSYGWFIAAYALAVAGCIMILISTFVQVLKMSEPERPIPWYRTWSGTGEAYSVRSHPKALMVKVRWPPIPKRWGQAVLLAMLIVVAGFGTYTLTQPVSSLVVQTDFWAPDYGTELDVSVYVDGRIVSTVHLTGGSILDGHFRTQLTPGEHLVGIDYANGTATLDGVCEYSHAVRILPYTEQHERYGFGVGYV